VVDGCDALTVVHRPCEERTKQWKQNKEAKVPAKGSAEWKGDVPTGNGTFTAGDSISGGYTYKSRFEDGPGSNPEQLIAAAHAACFSMALSNLLAKAGSPPDSVHTDATVTLRPVDGTPTITKIALVTVGRVPGLDERAFVEHALAAEAGCPVSRALASVPEITLEATLLP
jgi:osmotically inducible protein OsmC